MPAAQQIETRPGLTYATHDGVALLGDLYVPAGAGPFPALVAVHGGGWQAGARTAFQFWGPYLAARGYVLFAISYRLAKKGQKMFPQAVTDVLAAVQFVRGSAAEIKVDPERVGLFGASAGAHLPALADRRIPAATEAGQLLRAPLYRAGRAPLLAQRSDRGAGQLFRLHGAAPHPLPAGAAVRIRNLPVPLDYIE